MAVPGCAFGCCVDQQQACSYPLHNPPTGNYAVWWFRSLLQKVDSKHLSTRKTPARVELACACGSSSQALSRNACPAGQTVVLRDLGVHCSRLGKSCGRGRNMSVLAGEKKKGQGTIMQRPVASTQPQNCARAQHRWHVSK